MTEQPTPLMDTSYFEQLFSPYPDFSNVDVRPAYFDSKRQVWHVFRYTEVQRVLSNYRGFSPSQKSSSPTLENSEDAAETGTINQGLPSHTVLRKLISRMFTPRITNVVPKIREIVESLLIRVKAQGYMDLVDDLAHPLPSIIVAALLGVPMEDHLQFRRLALDYMNFMTPESTQAASKLRSYFEKLVEDHRQHPCEDLISDLVAAEADGERLTSKDLIDTCMFFIVAGQAPSALLTNTILAFDAFPHIQPILRAHPEKIPTALEEVLRFFSPLVSIRRFALEETMIDEQTIPKGASIVTWISAANRDASQFVNPAVFDMERSPNRHLTFGFGIHFCLGAPLARLEAKIALEVIFHHLQAIALDHTTPLVRVESPLIFSVKHAPITFKG
ncbi:MAG: cytochrome P450 [Ktedonobacteraceae bacterium]|nr:cytochrome P450 [Ktedonobacteraceae bacterium]